MEGIAGEISQVSKAKATFGNPCKNMPSAPSRLVAHSLLLADDAPFVEVVQPIFPIHIIQVVDIVRRVVRREAFKITAQIFFDGNVFQRDTIAGVEPDAVFDCLSDQDGLALICFQMGIGVVR